MGELITRIKFLLVSIFLIFSIFLLFFVPFAETIQLPRLWVGGGGGGGGIDLVPHETSLNEFGIEPIQAGRTIPQILIKDKAVMVRSFVDLVTSGGRLKKDLNTLDKPAIVRISIDGSIVDEVEVVFYVWYDFADSNPFVSGKLRTYAFPTNNQQIIQDFVSFVESGNPNDLNKVRRLVFIEGIDAVNLFEGNKSYMLSTNSSPVFIKVNIDPNNAVVESNEENNFPIAQSFQLRQINPDIKFDSFIAYYSNIPDDFMNSKAQLQSKIFKQWQYLIATFPIPSNTFIGPSKVVFLSEICPKLTDTKSESQVVKCLKSLNGYNWFNNLVEAVPSAFIRHKIYFVPSFVNLGTGTHGITYSDGWVSFVDENSLGCDASYPNCLDPKTVNYFVSAHEMAHQFDVDEQYSAGIRATDWDWWLQRNAFPFGFLAEGWDVRNVVYKYFIPEPLAGPLFWIGKNAKVNSVPFNGTIGDIQWEQYNHYSFMALTEQIWLDGYAAFDRWVDEDTWNQLLEEMTVSLSSFSQQPDQNIVVVGGTIFDQNNSAEFDSFFVVKGTPTIEFDGNTIDPNIYYIEIFDSNNQSLVSHRFVPLDISSNENFLFFSLGIVFPDNANKIVLKKNDLVLVEKIVSQNFPIVNIFDVNSVGIDFFQVDWNAFDLDGEQLIYSVDYSHNGVDFKPVVLEESFDNSLFDFNAANFAGSSQAFLRFIVTDGINTTIKNSSFFIVSNKAPDVAIVFPNINSSFLVNELISFEAFGGDEEDGFLPDSAFSWQSDLNGFLGFGQNLIVNDLNISGIHNISLTVTDSNGLISIDSIDINLMDSNMA